MKEVNVKFETSIRNSGFSAFLCSALGFVLLEVWIFRLGGKPTAHAFVVSVGAVFASIFYRTIVVYCAAVAVRSNEAPQDKQGNPRSFANVACAVLLVIFGYGGALALSSGSMTIFALFAICASIFPWSKFMLCRTYILIPAALITVAMVLGLLTMDQSPHPLLFPVAVWMLWMGAVSAWFLNIHFRHRKSKASRPVARQHDSEPEKAMQG